MELNLKLFVVILAELTGTALLMALGCLGCISTTGFEKSHVDVALSFGLILMICCYVFSSISGGFINPWVTTTACILGHIKWDMCLIYCAAQIIGGLIGYSLLFLALPERYLNLDTGLCVAKPKDELEPIQVVMGEFLATGLFLLVWAASLDRRAAHFNEAFAVRIGFIYIGLSVCTGYFTGTSMNLARSLPPIIFHGSWDEFWQPIVGQMMAVVVFPVLWRFVFVSPFEKNPSDTEAAA